MKHFSALVLALTTAVTVGFSVSARAAEIEEYYTGVRQLGMGGAYAAVVNDETAVLVNPAGLGKVRDTTFTIIDPEITASSNNTDVTRLQNFTKLFEIQELLEALKQHPGLHWNAKVQVFPSIISSNFGAGLHGKYSYNAEVDEAGNTFRLDYVNDITGALGYSVPLFGGIIKIGASARAVDRTEIHKDLPTSSTGLTVSNQGSEGLGVAADVGVILTAPIQYLPSIAIVGHDLGNTSYTLTDGIFHSTQNRPTTTPQTVDVGVAIFPIVGNQTRMTFTADYHDVLKAYEDETDSMKRIHVGAEINLQDFCFLRAGMNQRYWTGGIELATERFQLQFASYGEDIGTSSKPREDRRWSSKFVFRF
jgi:hypothetical protein